MARTWRPSMSLSRRLTQYSLTVGFVALTTIATACSGGFGAVGDTRGTATLDGESASTRIQTPEGISGTPEQRAASAVSTQPAATAVPAPWRVDARQDQPLPTSDEVVQAVAEGASVIAWPGQAD